MGGSLGGATNSCKFRYSHTYSYRRTHTHTHKRRLLLEMVAMVQGSGLGFCHLGPSIRTYSHIQCALKTMGTYSMLQILPNTPFPSYPSPLRPRPFLWAKPNNGDKQLKSVRFVLGHRISTLGNLFAHWKGLSSPVGGGCLWPPKPPTTPSLQNPSAPPCLAQWPAVRQFAGENRILYRF